MVVLAGHRAHLSYMAKLRFDDTDYSVVVKNRGVPPKSWVGDLSRREIESDRAVAGLFSHRGGRQQSRKGGTQAVAGQAQHLAIAFSKISVEA